MNVYRIHYVDGMQQDHELGRYISARELDPHDEEDCNELRGFINRNFGDDEVRAWLHFAPSMPDSGLERIQ